MSKIVNSKKMKYEASSQVELKEDEKEKNLFVCDAPTYLDVWTPEEREKKKIVHPEMKQRTVLNVFRNLRTKLMNSENESFSLLVSSVISGGGASFIAANLAATIAMQRNRSSVLIDANLYNPDLTSLFGLKGKPGLSEYLSGDTDVEQAFFYPTGVPNLYVMPAGNVGDDGLELFTGARMKALVNNLVQRISRGYVVLDAPSVTDSADTPILLESCQKSLLVLPGEGVHKGVLESSIESMKRANFIGAVYNRTRI